MPCIRSHTEDLAEPFAGPPSGLDRMAVRAQRDHLPWMIATAVSQVVDVIYFEDRVTAVSHVGGLTGTAGVLTLALAAKEDSPAGGSRAHRVKGGPGDASACSVGFPVLGDAAQLVIFRARITRRASDAHGVGEVICNRTTGQAQVLKKRAVVLALEVGVQDGVDNRDAGCSGSPDQVVDPYGQAPLGWLASNQRRNPASPCAAGTSPLWPCNSHRPA